MPPKNTRFKDMQEQGLALEKTETDVAELKQAMEAMSQKLDDSLKQFQTFLEKTVASPPSSSAAVPNTLPGSDQHNRDHHSLPTSSQFAKHQSSAMNQGPGGGRTPWTHGAS